MFSVWRETARYNPCSRKAPEGQGADSSPMTRSRNVIPAFRACTRPANDALSWTTAYPPNHGTTDGIHAGSRRGLPPTRAPSIRAANHPEYGRATILQDVALNLERLGTLSQGARH